MKISIYTMSVETFAPVLRSLSAVLDKGAAHANAGKSDPGALASARLAPDMYPLTQQVQLACDCARDSTARLLGEELKPSQNNEQTLDQLKARIATTIDYLRKAQASAFDGAEDRAIRIPIPENKIEFQMNGLQFLRDWALPNFYFHVVTAYDILRHNGVAIGKGDYLGQVVSYMRNLG